MEGVGNYEEEEGFFPFRGLFAWFSSSVHPDLIKQWDYYGGQFGDVGHADYLFSESEVAEDTVSIHENQPDDMVIKPDWIASVIHQQKPVGEVSLGEHLLLPQYCYPPHENDNSLQFYTPERDSYDVPPCVTMKEYRLEDVLRSEYRPEDNSTRSNEHTNNETKEQEDKEEIVDKNIEKEQVRKEKEKEQSQNLLKAKDDVPTSTVEGVTIMFPLKGGRYDVVRIHQLEPADALHINSLEPLNTFMVDFTPNSNGHTVERRTTTVS